MSLGGKQPSTVTQTSKVELTPEQRQLMALAFPFAQQYAETPLSLYGGSGITGFNPLEVEAQQRYVGAAGGLQGQAAAAAAANMFGLDPAQLSIDANPYLRQRGEAITGGVTQNLLENILPRIRGEAQGAGGIYSGGSTRQGVAEGLAVGRTSSEIANALSELGFRSYEAGLQNMVANQKLTPQIMASQLFGPDVLAAVGGQQRGLEQAQLDEEINRFYLEQQLPFLRAQELYGLVSGIPGAGSTTTVRGAQPKANPLMSGVGGAAAGAGLATALGFSGPIGAGVGLLAALMSSR